MLALVRPPVLVALLLIVAGCGGRPDPVLVSPPPVVATIPPPRPPLPVGATPGMAIPPLGADNRYLTPNRGLSTAGAVWHLRAALNVAALACRGSDEPMIVAGYNALLAAHRTTLAAAETRLAAEYRTSGDAAWRDRYDDAMTRLYNFFSQSPARPGFCRAAVNTLNAAATVPAGDLERFAAEQLVVLEQPFTDFYRAYDAWRRWTPMPGTVIAVAATPPAPAPPAARSSAAPLLASPGPASPGPASVPPVQAPRLGVDPSVLIGH